ncbi:hypothetical protein L1887_24038 [Cichorium endivia]|nr:hypothetical protein L1887_24038 [Cichorium endivia]
MLDEMKQAGGSKHSGTVVKKKSSSRRLIIKKKVAGSVGGVSGSSDSSSRNLYRSSKGKKRRRVVESDSESSDNSSETTRQKVDNFHKRSAVYRGPYSENREFETEKRVRNGLDVFEFDEYDGFVYSRPTYNARSLLEMEDDDFDLPLSVLSKKYRSSPKQPVRLLQGKNGVLKVTVNKNKQMDVSHKSCDEKESKPQAVHKKKLDKNDDTNSKEKGELKSLNLTVEKSSKQVNESDNKVMQSKSNSIVGTVENVKNTEKQILREKIKNLLLSAGWTIDYRPRKNRNYMDAIYTNPAGTAYWSIIKAYEAVQKEEKDSGSFTPLPIEILGKLERQTQKKMETEMKKKRKDEGNGRNAKRGMEELKRKSRKLGRSTLLVRDPKKVIGNDGFAPYQGKRTILGWLIDSGVVDVSEHVEYMNGRRTRILQKGRVTRDGIHCGCCGKILPVSKFEEHSGSKLCNPFPNMFLESGKSLMQCQIDAWNNVGDLEQKGFYSVDVDGDDPNDDTCGVCGDGGDLICCDGCPSTFHQNCLDIEMLPEGDWLCPNCSCKYCEMAGGKAEASLLTCSLCYKKYHESCRPGIDVKPHEPNSLDLSFCGHKCHEVYILLQKIVGVKHELDSGFSWCLIHRSDSLTGGERVECNSMLAVAMSVMDECFLPFTDTRSRINLIRNVVFNCGSNLSRLNYSGFYTAILEKGDEVVCAASIRFHGTQLAEMPFIGTRHIYRRQGMCRRLLSAIESALSALRVDKLIIPAVAEHMNTWTDVFSFQPLEESQKQEMKYMNMLVFPGTDMLQKPIPANAIPKDKNATRDATLSKEILSINPPDKDESSCEPELQLPGKESDSIHSPSDSKVDKTGVQNGNGTNPLPAKVHDAIISSNSDIQCKSQKQVPAAPSEPKLQQSGKESDSIHSHSGSKVDEIANGTNPEEGSCGNERNRKEKERGL